MTTAGSETVAASLMNSLLTGESFTAPTVDLTGSIFGQPASSGPLYAAVDRVTNDKLTTGTTDGTGVFDALMRGFDASLKREYDAGRITGSDYAKAYVSLTEAAMGNAVQFLLGQEQAYWQSLTAQQQAQAAQVAITTARVGLEAAKLDGALKKEQIAGAHFEVLTGEANYALTKLKMATEDASFGILLIKKQSEQSAADTAAYTLTNILPKQLQLVTEQAEAQRAQTSDTRLDGNPVAGTAGQQKALYAQQVTSYKRDAENKAAKLFTDAWITMKTIDDGLVPPNGFTNANLDTLLTSVRTNNGI